MNKIEVFCRCGHDHTDHAIISRWCLVCYNAERINKGIFPKCIKFRPSVELAELKKLTAPIFKALEDWKENQDEKGQTGMIEVLDEFEKKLKELEGL